MRIQKQEIQGKQPGKVPAVALYCGDCLSLTHQRVTYGEPLLIIEDPPYNIGQPYSDYADKKTKADYLAYMQPRVAAAYKCLNDTGSYWLAINDANAAELKLRCEAEGFYLRKWMIWAYSFGQNNPKNFTSSHTHWLYFTKHRTQFIFNHDDASVRVPSARQLIYKDKRANSKGRLPDDVWVLRPQFVEPAPPEIEDTWFFSRVCGTFKAKSHASPNQMPVPLLQRIVKFCSNPGDLVMDRFVGSGSTAEAAISLGRRFIGMDISAACIAYTEKRLKLLESVTC